MLDLWLNILRAKNLQRKFRMTDDSMENEIKLFEQVQLEK